jgi:putative membrane protein
MNIVASVGGIFGLAVLTGLAAYFGFDSVAQAIVSSEWGTLLIVCARAFALAAAGLGWWLLLRPAIRSPNVFIALRFVREAINSLFPLAVVGGDIIGARLLRQFGIPGNLAIASVLIDIFVQVVCLLIFVVAGLAVLLNRGGTDQLAAMTTVMLAISVPAVIGFFLALNFGAFDSIVRRLIIHGEKHQWAAFGHVVDVGDRLQQIWRNRHGLSGSFLIHLVGVFFGAMEVWIALAFMGHGVSLSEAVAIESLGQGSRAAAFAVPGGLGVQDVTLIAVCAVFGIPAEVALAMALIKRVPDLVLGVPTLVAWQVLEGRRLLSETK